MPPFISTGHFLDLIVDDKKVNEKILTSIITQNFYISKYLNTSYTDLDTITFYERQLLFKLVTESLESEQKQINSIGKT